MVVSAGAHRGAAERIPTRSRNSSRPTPSRETQAIPFGHALFEHLVLGRGDMAGTVVVVPVPPRCPPARAELCESRSIAGLAARLRDPERVHGAEPARGSHARSAHCPEHAHMCRAGRQTGLAIPCSPQPGGYAGSRTRLWPPLQRASLWSDMRPLFGSHVGHAASSSWCAGRFVPSLVWFLSDNATYARWRAPSPRTTRGNGSSPTACSRKPRIPRLSSTSAHGAPGDEADPEVTLAAFRKLQEAVPLDPQHRVFAARRVAWDLRRTGDVRARPRPSMRSATCARSAWWAPSTTKASAASQRARARDRPLRAPSSRRRLQGRERDVRFRELPDVVQGGYISFDAVFRPTENVCGFAETSLLADKRAAASRCGSAAAAPASCTSTASRSSRTLAYRAPSPDRDVALVQAKQGENRVLVKSLRHQRQLGLLPARGRCTGRAAGACVPTRARSKRSPRPAAAHEGRQPQPMSVLRALEQAAANAQAQGAATSRTWRAFSGTPAPTIRPSGAPSSSRGAPPSSSPRRALVAGECARRRALREAALRGQGARARSQRPEVVLAHAQLVSRGPSGESALAMLDGLPDAGTIGPREGASAKSMLAQPARARRQRARGAARAPTRKRRAPRSLSRPAARRASRASRGKTSWSSCARASSRCATITSPRAASCSRTPSRAARVPRRSSTSTRCARCSRATRSACSSWPMPTTRSAATT